MDVSENSGAPKSSILIGSSIINHPFWGTTIFGNTHMCGYFCFRFGIRFDLSFELIQAIFVSGLGNRETL